MIPTTLVSKALTPSTPNPYINPKLLNPKLSRNDQRDLRDCKRHGQRPCRVREQVWFDSAVPFSLIFVRSRVKELWFGV